MKKVLKWIGIALVGVVGVVLITVIVLVLLGGSKINKSYDIQPETIAIPTDGEALARGQHLEDAVLDCTFCHGDVA